MHSTINATLWILALCLFGVENVDGQSQDAHTDSVGYNVNYWITVPVISVGAVTNSIGLDRARDKMMLTADELMQRKRSRVPAFDRISLRQNTKRYKQAEESSDIGITWGTLAPAILIAADRRMRKDWLDVALTYIEAQTLTSNFYAWSFLGPTFIERYRPITYYDDVPQEERLWGGNRNSFYSGHVSVTAVTTFFMAQSYLDYHPEHRKKRWIYYGLAAIPPVVIGIKRVRALKHFPSDVTVGFIIGAAGGILLPQLHRPKKHKPISVSLTYEPEWKVIGCALSL